MLVAAVGALLFAPAVLAWLPRLDARDQRATVRVLGWLGAGPLVGQAPFAVWANLNGPYSARRRTRFATGGRRAAAAPRPPAATGPFAAACLATAVVVLLVVPTAFLLGPVIVVCAGLLATAALAAVASAVLTRPGAGVGAR